MTLLFRCVGQALAKWIANATPEQKTELCQALLSCGNEPGPGPDPTPSVVVTTPSNTILFEGDGTEDEPLKASVRVLPDLPNNPNAIREFAQGLHVALTALSLEDGVLSYKDSRGDEHQIELPTLETEDSDSVKLSGDGTEDDPLKAEVKLSEEEGNALEAKTDGLFVEAPEEPEPFELSSANSDTVELTGDGTEDEPLKAEVKLSEEEGNVLEAKADGLFVEAPEGGGGGTPGLISTDLYGNLDESTLDDFTFLAPAQKGGVIKSTNSNKEVNSGMYSVAIGLESVSQGASSIAIGREASSKNLAESIALGAYSQTRGGVIAIGPRAKALHTGSIAIGPNATTSKNYQVAFGYLDENTHLASTPKLLSGVATPEVDQDAANKKYVDDAVENAGGGGGAAGLISTDESGNLDGSTIDDFTGTGFPPKQESTVSSNSDKSRTLYNKVVALGFNAYAAQEGNISIGAEAESSTYRSILIGHNAKAEASESMILGSGSHIQGNTSRRCILIGHNLSAPESDTIVLSYDLALSKGRSVIIGNFIVNPQHIGDYSVLVGSHTEGRGDSVSIGRGATVKMRGGVAIGNGARIAENFNEVRGSVALGLSSKSEEDSVTVGAFSEATSTAGVCVGYNTKTTGIYSIAIGSNAKAEGGSSTALGHRAKTTGYYSTALGRSAQAEGGSSTALGADSNASSDNEIRLGTSSETVYAQEIVETSDERDKTDIEDISFGLDFINQLRPVQYKDDPREFYKEERPEEFESDEEREAWEERNRICNLTSDGSKKRSRTHLGLIAQEVAEVCGPDVAVWKDLKVNGGNDQLSLAYTQLIAPLIKAVQELSEEVDQLKAQLKE